MKMAGLDQVIMTGSAKGIALVEYVARGGSDVRGLPVEARDDTPAAARRLGRPRERSGARNGSSSCLRGGDGKRGATGARLCDRVGRDEGETTPFGTDRK